MIHAEDETVLAKQNPQHSFLNDLEESDDLDLNDDAFNHSNLPLTQQHKRIEGDANNSRKISEAVNNQKIRQSQQDSIRLSQQDSQRGGNNETWTQDRHKSFIRNSQSKIHSQGRKVSNFSQNSSSIQGNQRQSLDRNMAQPTQPDSTLVTNHVSVAFIANQIASDKREGDSGSIIRGGHKRSRVAEKFHQNQSLLDDFSDDEEEGKKGKKD